MSVTPPARLLTVSEPGFEKQNRVLNHIRFSSPPLELEHYSVLVGCKYEGIMTLATSAAYVPLRAVKHLEIWKMCRVRV